MATLENFKNKDLYSNSYDYTKLQGIDGAKPRTYEGTMLLISGITQKNGQTFPLVHAKDIQLGQDENERVTDKFEFIDQVFRDIYGTNPTTLEGYSLASLAAIAGVLNNKTDTVDDRITALRAFKTIKVTTTSTAVTDLTVTGNGDTVANNNAGTVTLAPANKWLKLKSTAASDKIEFAHLVQTINTTTSAIDYNSDTGTFAIDTFTYDEAGHIRSKNTETITLPDNYKTITLAAPVTDTSTVTNNSTATDVTASSLVDKISFKIGNKWLRSSVDTTNKVITFGHWQMHEADVEDTTTNKTPNFGATFTVPNLKYDTAGHIVSSSTHTVKIPLPSISTTANNTGNVLTDLSLTASTGALTRTFNYIGALALTGYENNSSASAINASDSLNTALSKLEKQIAKEVTDRGTAITKEITDRNSAIETAVSAEAQVRSNADSALQDAIDLINNNATTPGSFAYAVAQEASARSAADEAVQSAAAADATSKANTAESNANAYTNAAIGTLANNATDVASAIDAALTSANNYTDTCETTCKTYADGCETTAKAYADDCEDNANTYTDNAISGLNTNWATNSATEAARNAIAAVDAKFADYTPTNRLAETLGLSNYVQQTTLNNYMLSTDIAAAIAAAVADLKENYSITLNIPTVELSLRAETTDVILITVSGPGTATNEVVINLYKDNTLIAENISGSYQVTESGAYRAQAIRTHGDDNAETWSNTLQITIEEPDGE